MKSANRNLSVNALTLAVQGALAVMVMLPSLVFAEDAEVAALTQPTNFVEAGGMRVSKDSAKFGEYNGLYTKTRSLSGDYAIGNFGLRGGDAYSGTEGTGGTMRWSAFGTDLGTTSRELGADIADQGEWKLGIRYDELRHNITDSFQTPLVGAMGGNNFTMPVGFGIINTKNNALNGTPYGGQALTPTQQSYFHNEDVYSERRNSSISAGLILDRHSSIQFDYNRLVQRGAKLISSGTDGNVTVVGSTVAGYAPGKENIQMLMNPTNYTTDTVNLALNWTGDKGHFTAGVYGSFFRDAYSSVSFSNPFTSVNLPAVNGTPLGTAFPVNALSTAPDNNFGQLNFSGGYALAPKTKLTGGFSYGVNTQNVGYVNADQMQVGGLPQSSLNGLVVNTHGDLKLTDQTNKDLTLTAGFKYNERNNHTAANTYKFMDLGVAAETAVSVPMSSKKSQLELAGDYRIDKKQSLRLGYEREQILRWCNSTLSNYARGAGPASYYTTASCTQVPESNEDKVVTNYKLKATDDLSLTAGYGYAQRKATVNTSFYNPLQANTQGYENYGYIAFFDASRTEQILKAGANWQSTERLNIGLNGRYTKDDYDDTTLGVQTGSLWSLNLDGTYNLGEKSSISAFMTAQKRQRNLFTESGRSTTTLLATTWQNNLTDQDYTVGLSLKQGGLMSDKLKLAADLTYSTSKSGYTTTLNYAAASCTAPSTSGYSCGSSPDITSKLTQFKLTGDYSLNKSDTLVMGFLYQHLAADDYFYNAYQMGYTTTGMTPSNQQSPSYNVSTVFVVYNHSFAGL